MRFLEGMGVVVLVRVGFGLDGGFLGGVFVLPYESLKLLRKTVVWQRHSLSITFETIKTIQRHNFLCN